MPFLVEKKGRSESPTHSPIPFGLGAKERAEEEKPQALSVLGLNKKNQQL